MRLVHRGRVLRLCVAFLCAILPNIAQACSCRPTSVRDAVANADVVFRGTIIEIRDAQRDVITNIVQPRKLIAVFRVRQVWKGDVAETFEMPAIKNPGGICVGFGPDILKVGNEVLVYAIKPSGTADYVTSICSRTRLARESTDFQELGPGMAPKGLK